MQSEFYFEDDEAGVKVPSMAKMMLASGVMMDLVTFNGYANQYVENPIKVKVGEPVRIFVVNAGPNVWSQLPRGGRHLRQGLRQRQPGQ